MSIVQGLFALLFAGLVIVAALKDVTSFTIPNWVSLALIGAFPLAALAAGVSVGAFGVHVAIGVGALLAGMGMFFMGWIGGGDAKLFAAAALWLGWRDGMTYLLVTGLAGGALSVALMSLRSTAGQAMIFGGPSWFERLCSPKESVPYGVAIAAGALAAFPASPLAAGFLSHF